MNLFLKVVAVVFIFLCGFFVAENTEKLAAFAALGPSEEQVDEENFQAVRSFVAKERQLLANVDLPSELNGVDTRLIAEKGQTEVIKTLFDPQSAQFRDVVVTHNPNSYEIVVCGLVNGKNRLGGFTGFQAFAVEVPLAQNYPAFKARNGHHAVILNKSFRSYLNKCGMAFGVTLLRQ